MELIDLGCKASHQPGLRKGKNPLSRKLPGRVRGQTGEFLRNYRALQKSQMYALSGVWYFSYSPGTQWCCRNYDTVADPTADGDWRVQTALFLPDCAAAVPSF